ncbi:MAG: hypothetical protein QOG02_1931 [Gaiellales bacterium]|nr:hypothetical protein [Gaiellales bacterium]
MTAAEHGEGQSRTADTAIFSRVLYQLSYLAAAPSVPRRLRPRPHHEEAASGTVLPLLEGRSYLHTITPRRRRQGANSSCTSLPDSASISSAALPRLIAIESRRSESSNTTSSPLATSAKVRAQNA